MLPRMTVLENLRVGGLLVRDDRRVAARMEELFETFPRLRKRRGQVAGTLLRRRALDAVDRPRADDGSRAHGLRRALARAFAAVVSEVFGIVRRLKAAGLSILLVEQNVRQTLDVADYGYVLVQGQRGGRRRRGSRWSRMLRTAQGVFRRSLSEAKPQGRRHAVSGLRARQSTAQAERVRAGGAALVRRLRERCDEFVRAFHGIQGKAAASGVCVAVLPLDRRGDVALPTGRPCTTTRGSSTRTACYTHIVAAYWVDRGSRDAWLAEPHVSWWWERRRAALRADRLFPRELTVPVERQESIVLAGLSGGVEPFSEVALYPTPYCGYYGAMRDRIPARRCDDVLELPGSPICRTADPRDARSPAGGSRRRQSRGDPLRRLLGALRPGARPKTICANLGHRWSAAWPSCARVPRRPAAASLRFQQTCDAAGPPQLETHALGLLPLPGPHGELGRAPRLARRHLLGGHCSLQEISARPTSCAPGTRCSCLRSRARPSNTSTASPGTGPVRLFRRRAPVA